MTRIPGEPLLHSRRTDEEPEEQKPQPFVALAALDDSAPSRRSEIDWRWWAVIVGAPLVIVILARPDFFHVQDGIDPYVNRGYVEDLGALISRISDRHYFVTRWTLYLPGRWFFLAFGTPAGYLLHHSVLLGVALVPLAVWARDRWGWAASSCAYVVALCSPAVIRAVFTEYSTAVAVPFLTAAAVLLLGDTRHLRRAAAAGALLVGAAIANPFAAAPAAVWLVCWAVWRILAARRAPWREAGFMVAAGGAVILFGLWWFRWRYGISNVYQPTLDWIDLPPTGAEVVRASDASWLNARLWIYLPLFLTATWASLWIARRQRPPGYQVCAWAAMVATGVLQSWYQLSGEVIALELFVYWSYQLPTVLVVMTIVIGELISSSHRFVMALVIPVAIVCVIPLRPTWIHLPIAVVSVPLLVGLSVTAGLRHRSAAAPALVATIFLLPQLATPADPQRSGLRIDASYDSAFGGLPFGPSDDPPAEQTTGLPWVASPPGRQGWGGLLAVREFTRTMESVEPAVRGAVWLWAGGGWGWQMASAYGGSRSDRLVNEGGMGSMPGPLPATVLASLEAEQPGYLAMLGTPDEVRKMGDELVAATTQQVTELVRATVDPDGRTTEVVVVRVGGTSQG